MQIVRHNCCNKVTVRLWGRFLLLHNTKRNWEWHQFFRFQQFHRQDRNFASLDTQRTNPPQRLAKSLGRVKTSRTSRKQRTWEGCFGSLGESFIKRQSNQSVVWSRGGGDVRNRMKTQQETARYYTTGHRRPASPPLILQPNKSVGTV